MYIVVPAMDSYENDILISIQFSNDLVLPVPDSSYEVIMEHQLLSHFLHYVLEEPQVDRESTLREVMIVDTAILANIDSHLHRETCCVDISQYSQEKFYLEYKVVLSWGRCVKKFFQPLGFNSTLCLDLIFRKIFFS